MTTVSVGYGLRGAVLFTFTASPAVDTNVWHHFLISYTSPGSPVCANSTWLEARARVRLTMRAHTYAPPPPAANAATQLTARASAWQEHIDYLSVQSLLFQQNTLGIAGQLKLFFMHTRRLKD
jgi:hypothetical protein